MPSIYSTSRGRQAARTHPAFRSGSRRSPRSAPRASSRRLPITKSRGAQNVTKLSTFSNREEHLKIQFREEFDFSSMGGQAGSSPVLIRVDLNNPFRGLSNPIPANDDTLVQIVGQLKAGSIDPVFTRASYNSKYNLTDRLEAYAEEYRSCIVKRATVVFNVRPKLNQTYHNSGHVSVVPYLINQETAPGSGMYEVKTSTTASATGDLYVWSIQQQSHSQLHDAANGVLPLTTLKEGVPGMRMTKLNVTPVSTKGCKFKHVYSPKKMYQIKDILDNKEILNCLDGTQDVPLTMNLQQKRAFAYLGIGARIQGLDPDPSAGIGARALANCIVEATVEYELQFTERFNIDGNNEPTPVGRADQMGN